MYIEIGLITPSIAAKSTCLAKFTENRFRVVESWLQKESNVK